MAPVDAFFVRLWRPADSSEQVRLERDELHGVVERAGSGDAQPFRNGEQLLEFLRSALRERNESTRVGG